jgi:hypothetical protein
LRALLILGLLLCGLPVYAQPWSTLRSLAPGDRVKVRDTEGATYSGRFRAVSETGISVETGQREVSIERGRVRRVQVRSGARRVRRILIFSGIGLGVGVAADYTAGAYIRNEGSETTGQRALTYLAPVALFGGISAAFPAYRTIFRAP